MFKTYKINASYFKQAMRHTAYLSGFSKWQLATFLFAKYVCTYTLCIKQWIVLFTIVILMSYRTCALHIACKILRYMYTQISAEVIFNFQSFYN